MYFDVLEVWSYANGDLKNLKNFFFGNPLMKKIILYGRRPVTDFDTSIEIILLSPGNSLENRYLASEFASAHGGDKSIVSRKLHKIFGFHEIDCNFRLDIGELEQKKIEMNIF